MAASAMGASFNEIPLRITGFIQLGGLSPNNTNVVTAIEDLTVEQYVNKYFSDIPILVEVARCESQFRQHGKDGKVLVGLVNEFDLGVMQINGYYHTEKAEKLGLDLSTLEGNTAYARYLFEKKGLQPWILSAPCWKKTQAYKDYRIELALNSQNK